MVVEVGSTKTVSFFVVTEEEANRLVDEVPVAVLNVTVGLTTVSVPSTFAVVRVEKTTLVVTEAGLVVVVLSVLVVCDVVADVIVVTVEKLLPTSGSNIPILFPPHSVNQIGVSLS